MYKMKKSTFEEYWKTEYSKLATACIPEYEKGCDNHKRTDYRIRFIHKFLKSRSQLNILDAGCGIGIFSRLLFALGNIVTGIDYSQECITTAKNSYNGQNINYLKSNLYSIPVPNNTFDLVVCFGVLQHVDDAQKIVLELSRVTTNNGQIIISTKRQPTMLEILFTVPYLVIFQPHSVKYSLKESIEIMSLLKNRSYNQKIKNVYFPRRYTPAELKEVLSYNNLIKIKVYYDSLFRIGSDNIIVVSTKK